jgi:hypothetical protein
MLNVENFSRNIFSQKKLWTVTISLTAILFVVTGWTQFSCYPMVTGGVLPKFCNSHERILKIIQEPRTHGNTLMILAANPESDESVLRALTSSLDSPKVDKNLKLLKRAIAFNSKTPVDVLDVFVKSEDVGILENIAKRSNATPEILREVVKNPYADTFVVQKALVENPQTPEDVLKKLANSKESHILWAIANLKKASPSILREIANNPVTTNTKIQDEYLKNLPIKLAANQNTPEDVLKKLAASTNYSVLLLVTKNVNSSEAVMDLIGENPMTWQENGIQISLASKNRISNKLIQKLADSDDGNVLLALSQNSALPSELKNIVIERLDQYTDDLKIEISQPLDISDNIVIESKKNNCPNRHLRNNLLGGAAGALGFIFGGPVGALAAYGTVTASLETVTTIYGCQL